MSTARAFFYIQQLEQLARRQIDAALRGWQLTAGQFMALNLIASHQPVSCSELAKRANMTAQSMGAIVKALAAKGLLERRGGLENWRVIELNLTAAGVELNRNCETCVEQVGQRFYARLTDSELAMLPDLLCRVRNAELERLKRPAAEDQPSPTRTT
jgi:DNA-binding MarR family transcriptional regulator